MSMKTDRRKLDNKQNQKQNQRQHQSAAGKTEHGQFAQLGILFRKDIKEQLRNSHLLVLCAVFAFFGILSPVTAKYMPQIVGMVAESQQMQISLPDPSYHDAFMQYIKNFTQIGVIVIIFLAMGAVAKEKEDGTLAFLLVKPISRTVFLLSKLTAQFLVILASTLCAFVLSSFYTALFFDAFPLGPFAAAQGVLLLFFFTVLVVTLSFSVLTQRPITAGVLSLMVWLLFSALGEIPKIGSFSFTKLGGLALQTAEGFDFSWHPAIGAGIICLLGAAAAWRKFMQWEG